MKSIINFLRTIFMIHDCPYECKGKCIKTKEDCFTVLAGRNNCGIKNNWS